MAINNHIYIYHVFIACNNIRSALHPHHLLLGVYIEVSSGVFRIGHRVRWLNR